MTAASALSIRPLLSVMMACIAMTAAGCSDVYMMRGRVVEGPITSVTVVRDTDPRLAGPGIADAMLSFTLEPRGVDRESLGVTASDEAGAFQLPVDRLLAGFLEYKVEVIADADQFQSAVEVVDMPPANKRILVTLAPGRRAVRGIGNDLQQVDDDLRNFGTR